MRQNRLHNKEMIQLLRRKAWEHGIPAPYQTRNNWLPELDSNQQPSGNRTPVIGVGFIFQLFKVFGGETARLVPVLGRYSCNKSRTVFYYLGEGEYHWYPIDNIVSHKGQVKRMSKLQFDWNGVGGVLLFPSEPLGCMKLDNCSVKSPENHHPNKSRKV